MSDSSDQEIQRMIEQGREIVPEQILHILQNSRYVRITLRQGSDERSIIIPAFQVTLNHQFICTMAEPDGTCGTYAYANLISIEPVELPTVSYKLSTRQEGLYYFYLTGNEVRKRNSLAEFTLEECSDEVLKSIAHHWWRSGLITEDTALVENVINQMKLFRDRLLK